MSAAPLVMLLAGGTGGHVYPALAVAEILRERGYRVEWVGTRRGLEQRVVPAAGIHLHCLPVRGLRGKGMLQRLAALFYLVLALLSALVLLWRRAPRCVVGMGGYAAAPAGVAAWLQRRPLLLHEQNAVAGTTNRLLAPLARARLCGFPGAFTGRRDAEVVGNPLRAALLRAAQVLARDYREKEGGYDASRPLRVLVLGGSLGAAPLNRLLPQALAALQEQRALAAFSVWHQCGEGHLAALRADYEQRAPGAQVRCMAFVEDMPAAYGWADLAICRAGALTVAELALMRLPAILVPLPHAIDDHQRANARVLGAAGAALVREQAALDGPTLAAELRALAADPARLRAMSEAAAGCAHPDAGARVVERVAALAGEPALGAGA